MIRKRLIRIVGLSVILIAFQAGPAWAQSILIFSTSHNNTGPTEIKQADGVMKLVISSFSPIREVRINGETKPAPAAAAARFDVPYSLQEGENRFNVRVLTENAEAEKEFIFNFIREEAPPGEKPFRLITVAGLTNTDNATAVKEDKTSGTKLALTVIPRYTIELNPHSDLVVQGILLREKFSDSDLETYETVFTQLDAKYSSEAGFGDWQVALGWNDIGGKTEGLSADTEVETNIFVDAAIQLNALDNKNVSLGVKYTLKDAEDAASDEYEADGGLLNVNADWKRKISKVSGAVSADYDFNDARGMYKDYTAMALGIDARYPLNRQLSLKGGLDWKSTVYKENDPLKGDSEATTLTTAAVGGSCKLPAVPGLIILGDITARQQASNITTSEYNETSVSLSALYLF